MNSILYKLQVWYNGSNVVTKANLVPASYTSATAGQKIIDLPINDTLTMFLANFEQYTINPSTGVLTHSGTWGNRKISSGDVINTHPLALARANTSSLFATL